MSDSPPCNVLVQTNNGKAPVVTDEFGCIAELVLLNDEAYPAIEQVVSDSSVQLRNGSAKWPIELPHLQKQVGGSFVKMMMQNASGQWYVFTAPLGCVNYKLVIANGSFSFVEDVIPNLVVTDLCPVGQSADVEYVVGLKSVTKTCADGSLKQYYNWVLVPKATVMAPIIPTP